MDQKKTKPTVGKVFAEQPFDVKLVLIAIVILSLDFLLPLKVKEAHVVSRAKISTGRTTFGEIIVKSANKTYKVRFFIGSYNKIKMNDPVKVKLSLLTGWVQSVLVTTQTPVKITTSTYKTMFSFLLLFLGARVLFLLLAPRDSDWGI